MTTETTDTAIPKHTKTEMRQALAEYDAADLSDLFFESSFEWEQVNEDEWRRAVGRILYRTEPANEGDTAAYFMHQALIMLWPGPAVHPTNLEAIDEMIETLQSVQEGYLQERDHPHH